VRDDKARKASRKRKLSKDSESSASSASKETASSDDESEAESEEFEATRIVAEQYATWNLSGTKEAQKCQKLVLLMFRGKPNYNRKLGLMVVRAHTRTPHTGSSDPEWQLAADFDGTAVNEHKVLVSAWAEEDKIEGDDDVSLAVLSRLSKAARPEHRDKSVTRTWSRPWAAGEEESSSEDG
jgi:hypothetical protein